jgi:Type IV secretion system pilin
MRLTHHSTYPATAHHCFLHRPRRGLVTGPDGALPRGRITRSYRSHASAPPTVSPAMAKRCGGPGGAPRGISPRLLVITQLVCVCLVVTASSAHAQTSEVLALATSVEEVLTNIRNWIMGILAGLATVFLSIGGVRYVMGGGDPGEIEKAKTAFKAAGMGYGLAALAPLVVTVLKGIVGA